MSRDLEHVLLLDSGGTLFTGGYSTESDNPNLGSLMVKAMNAMGYDAMALGQRDLQANLVVIQQRFEQAEFPILSANVTPGRTLPNVQPFVLREVGGHTVAIVGMTPGMAAERLSELGLAPLAPDPIAVLKRAIKQAGRRADIIILLSTLTRPSLETLAQEVPGIDVAIGVDAGMQLTPVAIGGADGEVVLHAAATQGEYLGQLTLQVDETGQVTDFEGYAIALTDRYGEDPAMVALIREHVANP